MANQIDNDAKVFGENFDGFGQQHVVSTTSYTNIVYGATDECTGGTATASSANGSQVASNAFDDNGSTTWTQATASPRPQWITYDFGSGNDKTIGKIHMTFRSISESPTVAIFQGSDDNSNWNDVFSYDNASGSTNQTYEFYNGTAYRYYRFYIVETDASYVVMYEMEMFSVVSADEVIKIYASHITDTNNVEVHYSENNGADWILDDSFSETAPNFLSMCKSENNDIFLCVRTGSASPVSHKIYRRNYLSGAWSVVLTEAVSTTGNLSYALITYNRFINRLHMVWTKRDGVILDEKHSDDYGDSWTEGAGYSVGSAGACEGQLWGIDTDPSNGDIHIFSTHYITNPRVQIFNVNGGYSSTYGDNGAYANYGGAFAIADDGTRYRLYYEETNNKLCLRRNNDAFDLMDSGTLLLNEGMLAMGIDNAGLVYMFYSKQSDNKCYYRTYNPVGSVHSGELSFTAGQGQRPSCEQHTLPTNDQLHTVFFTD